MSHPEDYKNNPLYTDITKLDHLSPQPNFSYKWNSLSGRWEPLNFSEIQDSLSGISDAVRDLTGVLQDIHIGVDLDHDTETHKLLSGISGLLDEIHTGVDIDHDTETHRLLSGISGALKDIEGNVGITGKINLNPDNVQQFKLRTKTVTQKIEEDFILLEDIPDDIRYGISSGVTYGQDRSLMSDIYGTYYSSARQFDNNPETGHPEYFLMSEETSNNRDQDYKYVFHTDTRFGLRQENSGASLINSYELEDYNKLYERGLVDHVTLFNRSPYPLQFHTADRRFLNSEPVSPETDDILYLDPDFGVKINNDEAGRIFVKRPHTISGYTLTYSITYKVTGGLLI